MFYPSIRLADFTWCKTLHIVLFKVVSFSHFYHFKFFFPLIGPGISFQQLWTSLIADSRISHHRNVIAPQKMCDRTCFIHRTLREPAMHTRLLYDFFQVFYNSCSGIHVTSLFCSCGSGIWNFRVQFLVKVNFNRSITLIFIHDLKTQ